MDDGEKDQGRWLQLLTLVLESIALLVQITDYSGDPAIRAQTTYLSERGGSRGYV